MISISIFLPPFQLCIVGTLLTCQCISTDNRKMHISVSKFYVTEVFTCLATLKFGYFKSKQISNAVVSIQYTIVDLSNVLHQHLSVGISLQCLCHFQRLANAGESRLSLTTPHLLIQLLCRDFLPKAGMIAPCPPPAASSVDLSTMHCHVPAGCPAIGSHSEHHHG